MTERFNDGVIDLSQFRKEKEEEEQVVPPTPYFTEPTQMEFEDEDGNPVHYNLSMNLVHNGKQIVVLVSVENGEETGEVGIAEAVIKDGVFFGLQGIDSEEEFAEITKAISLYLKDGETEEADTDESADN